MNDHLGDVAALYALGALDRAEQEAVDAHVAVCTACAAELAQASEDVTAMALAQPQFEPPRALQQRLAATLERGAAVSLDARRPARRWYAAGVAALAAALVFGVLPSAYLWQENQAMHQAMLAESDAMARVATSPHKTVAFAATDARVMYGPDGSWYCVVVRGAHAPVQVAWKHDGRMTMLGTAMPHGDVAMLYLPKSHRMDHLALIQGAQVMGEAQLVF